MTKITATQLRLFDSALDYGQLPALTGFHLRRASLADFAGFGAAIGDRAVTPLRYSVLEVVGSNPGIQPIQLAAVLGLTRPTTSVAIDFWQERQCLARKPIPADRRARGIFLTDEGEARLAELRTDVKQHDAAFTSALTERELDTLHDLLRKLIDYNGS